MDYITRRLKEWMRKLKYYIKGLFAQKHKVIYSFGVTYNKDGNAIPKGDKNV